MGRLRYRLAFAAALTSCYRPAHEVACETFCSATDPRCPADMECGLDFRCHAAGTADCGDAAVVVEPDATYCYGTGLHDFGAICNPTDVTPSVTLSGTYNTDITCVQHTQVDGTTICVELATDITVDGALRLIGSRPLALIATHDLVVSSTGSIDVGSHVAGSSAGAGHGNCAGSPGINDVGGGGGGAGGPFQGAGGAGGGGDPFNGLPVAPGGSSVPPHNVPVALRGGCDASPGGGSPGNPPTNRGLGGGGIYLVAGHHLRVDGTIDAGGSGGFAAAPSEGGGGGGSGGMIAFDAPDLTITSHVAANGGGGAGGAGTTASSPGSDGTLATSPGASGSGGTAGPNGTGGGAGGSGSFMGSLLGGKAGDATGLVSGCGGGGGGGAAGYIQIFATVRTIDGATFSPLPLVSPSAG